MAIRIVLDNASKLAPGVWSAQLPPEDAAFLGTAPMRAGSTTVLLLPNLTPPTDDSPELAFEPSHARVLNFGTTGRAIVIYGGDEPAHGDEDQVERQRFGPGVQHDDQQFIRELAELPSELVDVGADILGAMRTSHGGYFQRSRVGRYVNRPDNFWTVKVQPRDVSLRFTVRGEPSRFTHISGIPIRPDRHGYSTFKVSALAQREAALQILREAGTKV